MKHYIDASQHGAMKSVNESAAVLMDLQTLQSIGFDTTFGVGLPSGLKVVDDVVQSQSALAHHLVQMFASVAFHRITSMLWHTASWPGLLAGLCSESVDVVDKTFVKLLDDYRIFLVAKTNAECNSLIGKLVRASPFNGRVMREICLMLTLPKEGCSLDDRKALVIKYAKYIFAGWGQTKICEDTFKEPRDREQRDTTNSNLSTTSYYAFMCHMGTIPAHKREELKIDNADPKATGVGKQTFLCKKHEPALEQTEKITSSATWPTFTPQSSKRIYADLDLFRQCDKNDSWGAISKCSQAVLFRRLDIIRVDGKVFMVLGHIQYTMLLLWSVLQVPIGRTNHNAYILHGEGIDNNSVIMEHVTDLKRFEIIPTVPICPLHLWLACRKQVPCRVGVVLLQTGPATTVLKHAARHCFFQLHMPQLKTISKEERIDISHCATIVPMLVAMIKEILKTKDGPPSDDTVADILALRCMEPCDDLTDVLNEDIAELMLDSADLETVKDCAL